MKDKIQAEGYMEPADLERIRKEIWRKHFQDTRSPEQGRFVLGDLWLLVDEIYVTDEWPKVKITIEVLNE